MKINERIRQIRKENKLTLEKFGEKIGVKKNTVSQWETGINNPSDQTIMIICKVFNINEEWLRYGTGSEKSYVNDTDEYLKACEELGITDQRLKQIIINYSKFNAKEKEIFWSFLHKLLQGESDIPQDDLIYRLYHTDSYVAETSPEEEYNTIEAAEAAYRKSRLNSTQKTTLSASNITTAIGTDDK